jgi:hypothetical protein
MRESVAQISGKRAAGANQTPNAHQAISVVAVDADVVGPSQKRRLVMTQAADVSEVF